MILVFLGRLEPPVVCRRRTMGRNDQNTRHLYLSFSTFKHAVLGGLERAPGQVLAFFLGDREEKIRIESGWAHADGKDFGPVQDALEVGEREGRIIWFQPESEEDQRDLRLIRVDGLNQFLAKHGLPQITLTAETQCSLLHQTPWYDWVQQQLNDDRVQAITLKPR